MKNKQKIDSLLAKSKNLQIDLGYYKHKVAAVESNIRAIHSRIAELIKLIGGGEE